MKVKKSFITNSSSISFVGFGIRLEKNKDLFEKLKNIIIEKNPDAQIDDDCYYYDLLNEILSRTEFLMFACPEDFIILGREYCEMPSDMTNRERKPLPLGMG